MGQKGTRHNSGSQRRIKAEIMNTVIKSILKVPLKAIRIEAITQGDMQREEDSEIARKAKRKKGLVLQKEGLLTSTLDAKKMWGNIH